MDGEKLTAIDNIRNTVETTKRVIRMRDVPLFRLLHSNSHVVMQYETEKAPKTRLCKGRATSCQKKSVIRWQIHHRAIVPLPQPVRVSLSTSTGKTPCDLSLWGTEMRF